MTIRHLKIFIEVAESGKMSIAASKFFVSQPTISQVIRELEAHYGVLLFERLSKKLYITEDGKRLLGYARQVVSQFELLEKNMSLSRNLEKMKIGASVTAGAWLLPHLIHNFKQYQREVDISSCVGNKAMIEEQILNSQLDVGLIEGEVSSRDLIYIPAIEDCLVLICSPEHPLAGRKEITAEELNQQKFVMWDNGTGIAELVERYFGKEQISVCTAWEVTCADAVKNAVLYDGCLAVLSAWSVEKEAREGKFCLFRSDSRIWHRKIYLVFHKDKLLSDTMKLFTDIVVNYQDKDELKDIQTGIITGGHHGD